MMDTQKGKPLVLCNGFLMGQHKKSSDGTRQFWRCQMFHKGCHGRAVSAFGSTTLKQTKPHDTHVASPAEAKTRQAITKAKRMAVASYGMPYKSILDAAKSELNEAEIQAFPKDEQIKKIITNARKPVRGNDVDKPLNAMVLSEEFRTTATGNRFLLCDSRETEPDKPVFLIFASDRGLDF
ncbi:FLYWCH zinc finger domain-containing protein [Ditylenchus destructor]|uniref:FLYWCH zinc finger domain-containing protein n=1 Tax=Ditylenchus destructor TaxID=166010 RepID=A0AAD4MGX7_9BILA|nr:FLYWCH zinc finger domain-containing protein [Ditylenchus destructor]